MTKATTDNINYLLHALPSVQLETESLKSSAKSLARHTKNAILARDILVSSGWIALVPIATSVRVSTILWSGNSENLEIRLDIPWDKQIEARHRYGGCFPEDVNRRVCIDSSTIDCGADPFVFRIHEFKHGDNKIAIRFYRKTFSGDVVNGCEIKKSYRPSMPDYYFRGRESHLSVTCPIIPGKKS